MDFIPELDKSLSDKDKAKLLDRAYEQIRDHSPEVDELSEHDSVLLRKFVVEDGPEVRAAAIDILAEFGPVSWEDAEQWMMDDNGDVRQAAFIAAGLEDDTALGELCWSDKARCAGLCSKSAVRYGGFTYVDVCALCEEDPEWVDIFWSEIGPLLDLGDEQLTGSIICGVLEEVLDDGLITVDDPRVQSWINGDSIERKMALLSLVQWLGMREPWEKQIAEALSKDKNEIVSSTASSFLSGKPLPDIQCREWATK